MTAPSLRELAAAAGLQVEWTDAGGRARRVPDRALRALLDAMSLPAASAAQRRATLHALRARARRPSALHLAWEGQPLRLPLRAGTRYRLHHEDGAQLDGRAGDGGRIAAPPRPGYYTLEHGGATLGLAVAPPRCHLPAGAARRWGLALQVYAATGAHDAGIGDCGGAADWGARALAHGGDALALSPVHAAHRIGRHYSPYSPGDRRFLEPVHAAPAHVLGAAAEAALHEAGLAPRFARLQERRLVDWPQGAAAKWAWLRVLHARLARMPDALRADFAAFVADGGAALERYARFAARADGPGGDSFETAVDLQRFGQWLAARGWAALQRRLRADGMAIGLVADLAVGFDPAGAEAAAWPDAVLHGLRLGAPPDAFNADGQCWGVTGYAPAALRAHGYAPFIELLRAVMRDRGGVRIDHVLGLLRLWVVPEGAGADQGAYLRYPLQDLLRLLALESWRHRCLVIGEDLGTVPPGFRARLARHGVLGTDVLMFMRDRAGRFLPASRWRRLAVATTTTHDLPTLAGWRAGRDLEWRARLDPALAATLARDRAVRRMEVAALDARAGGDALDPLRHVAATPAALALLPVEDALGLEEQPNLPGTVGGHPNWRRRLPPPGPAGEARLQAFAHARRGAAA